MSVSTIFHNLYTTMYSIDFTLIKTNNNLLDALKEDNYWVYSYVVEKPYDLNDPDLFSRVYMEDEYVCLKKDKYDEDYQSTNYELNPRTELRLGKKYSYMYKNIEYKILLVNKITDIKFSANFIQIMSRDDKGAGPLLSLEVRDKWFTARFARINPKKIIYLGQNHT